MSGSLINMTPLNGNALPSGRETFELSYPAVATIFMSQNLLFSNVIWKGVRVRFLPLAARKCDVFSDALVKLLA